MGDDKRKQAVISCRMSSINQTKDGDGLRSQKTRCQHFATRKGYAATDMVQDDVCDSLVDRPGMKAMLAAPRKPSWSSSTTCPVSRGLQAPIELRGLIAGAGGTLESTTRPPHSPAP